MEDERYYSPCPLRKNKARLPLTICKKQRCIHLTSDGGKLKCGFDLANYGEGKKR